MLSPVVTNDWIARSQVFPGLWFVERLAAAK